VRRFSAMGYLLKRLCAKHGECAGATAVGTRSAAFPIQVVVPDWKPPWRHQAAADALPKACRTARFVQGAMLVVEVTRFQRASRKENY
jgi:hypothetical protein